MALRDISAYQLWIDRERPTPAAQRVARAFIAELGDQPWRAPSIPIAELSLQPDFEVRHARLEVRGESAIELWYRHQYATDDVDLIAVTSSAE